MGMGREFKCDKCGAEGEIFLGVGFMYPSVCKELAEKIRCGKYGKAHQKALAEHPDAMVDGERRLYQCECGYWKADYVLDICETEEQMMRWTVAEGPVKATRWFKELPSGEKVVIKKYEHKCYKCGRVMKDVTDSDDVVFRCKKCHEGELFMYEGICWD